MKCLLFVILAGCAVKCDDNNYYVIEMPEDRLNEEVKPFSVFWNVPTMQCKSKKIPFTDLYEKYGILQNKNDSFRGEEISILYDPGLFPALLKNETSGKFKFRNGGVPQEGNLELHLKTFRSVLEQSIPDPDFHGVGIIDFESWRPIFRQNFGVLVPYKDISTELEKKMHWWWPKQWIQAEAKQRFEEAARTFMQTSLSVAKQMRPKALWGYYGFPYCFNMAGNKMRESCADKVPEENDRTYWLWSESTALYPSVYSSKDLTSFQLAGLIRGRVKEAERLKRKNTPVLPYFWFRYRDGGYLTEGDLGTALETLYKSNASGLIIWGSSNDVNTVDKCKKLLKYVENTLGPAVAAFTKPTTKFSDMPQEPAENTTDPVVQTIHNDPDIDWEPPANYAQDIKNYVEEEIKRKRPQYNTINETLANVNDSVLMDIILNSLMVERNMSKNEMKGLPFVDISTDSYRQSHVNNTSQAVDISTSIVQIKNDTNIPTVTDLLHTGLLNNNLTETNVSSPESLVTTFLQNNPILQDVSTTTVAAEIAPNKATSQSSTEFSVTKLQQNQVITDFPPLRTTKSYDLKNNREPISTEFVTVHNIFKNIDVSSRPSSTEFTPYEDPTIISSMKDSTTELKDKSSPIESTDSISTQFVMKFQESSEGNNLHSSEDFVTKFITKDISSTEITTMESAHSSQESSEKTFSEEYILTKSHDSNKNKVSNSIIESNSNINEGNEKQRETIGTEYIENKVISETTTAGLARTSEGLNKSKPDLKPDQNRKETEGLEFTTSTFDFGETSDKNTNDEMDKTLPENYNAINIDIAPFFNQNTFLDNTSPAAVNTIFSETSGHISDENGALENVTEFSAKEMDSTVSATTDLDQVNVYVL